jgi:hypothetical protein
MKKPRRNHSAVFNTRVALEAIRGEKTVAAVLPTSGRCWSLRCWRKRGSCDLRA